MREIKFRVWDENLQGMFNVKSILFDTSNGNKINTLPDVGLTLMQYTGLKDKNGTETYERDIIFDGKIIDYVTFDKGCFYLGNSGYLVGELKEYEVIGNIYENPELLKGAK